MNLIVCLLKKVVVVFFFVLVFFSVETQTESFDQQKSILASRLETSIHAESALVDKETSRIFWEGGESSTLSASVRPRLQELGVVHAKATFLTFLLFLAVFGALSSWLRKRLEHTAAFEHTSHSLFLNTLLFAIHWALLKTPRFDKYILITIISLYLLEAYSCSTRRYLANAITSPDGIEDYIENLRMADPLVKWKVRCFHYEPSGVLLSPLRYFQQLFWPLSRSKEGNNYSLSLFRRKVITRVATTSYEYKKCIDKTMAGVWKRAAAVNPSPAPFAKITLSKILLLSDAKTRDDFFRQQSEFVTQYGQSDTAAEFSTSIEVPSFKPRLLAVRPVKGVPSARLFRLHLFWLFTCLGLTVPYRIWFSRHCEDLRVTVIKETSAMVPAKPRSWFGSTRKEEAEEVWDNETFRKLMRHLKLYSREDMSDDELKNATTTVMEQEDLSLDEVNAFQDVVDPEIVDADPSKAEQVDKPDSQGTVTDIVENAPSESNVSIEEENIDSMVKEGINADVDDSVAGAVDRALQKLLRGNSTQIIKNAATVDNKNE